MIENVSKPQLNHCSANYICVNTPFKNGSNSPSVILKKKTASNLPSLHLMLFWKVPLGVVT